MIARGQGQSPGNRNDFFQFEEETKEFIACIKSLSYVDKTRIVVMGMSMGSNRSALAAYPNPEIKLLVLVSGPYDLKLTRSKFDVIPTNHVSFIWHEDLIIVKKNMPSTVELLAFNPMALCSRETPNPLRIKIGSLWPQASMIPLSLWNVPVTPSKNCNCHQKIIGSSSTGGIPLKVTNGSWESRYIALLLLICNHLIHFSILITIFTRIDNAKRNYRKNRDFR